MADWRLGQLFEWKVYFSARGRHYVFHAVHAKSPVSAIASIEEYIPDHATSLSCVLVKECDYTFEQSCPWSEENLS